MAPTLSTAQKRKRLDSVFSKCFESAAEEQDRKKKKKSELLFLSLPRPLNNMSLLKGSDLFETWQTQVRDCMKVTRGKGSQKCVFFFVEKLVNYNRISAISGLTHEGGVQLLLFIFYMRLTLITLSREFAPLTMQTCEGTETEGANVLCCTWNLPQQ